MALPMLTAHQEDAVKEFKEWWRQKPSSEDFFYLGGYAGTGKSTILPVLVDAIGIDPASVAFCAPTGKAAKVMSDKLRASGINYMATTIHSRIYRPKPLRVDVLQMQLFQAQSEREQLFQRADADTEAGKKRLHELNETIKLLNKDIDKAFDNIEGPKFQLNTESAIRTANLIVVDEASMVGSDIAADLMTFDVPIFVMGDPGQLPPVNDEPGFTAGEPDFFLTEVHRQAKDNPILRLATMAREGEALPLGRFKGATDDQWAEVIERRDDKSTYDLNREAQILVGTNKKRWLITNKLRKMLGYNTTGPCEGEPLIVCKNSRKHPGLVNGSFVYCARDVGDLEEGNGSGISLLIEDETGSKMNVRADQGVFEESFLMKKGAATAARNAAFKSKIENEHIDFGHAITTHKAQGSQWEDVILHDESGVFRDDCEKWLYTGLTRAAKRLTVVV